jgi:hypothetical protein
MRNWGAKPALTPAQQYLFLRGSPLCPGTGGLSVSGLIWNYRVRPTPVSRKYAIQIRFQRGGTPQVFVTEPDISALANGRPIPHVYRDPLHLCLFLPRAKEWDGTMRIDQTFVPWTEVWLYYFEEWLASDDWKGGGKHAPAPRNRKKRRAAA